jgi:hypothetical protein
MLGLSRRETKDDEVADDFQGEVGTAIVWVQWPAILLEPLSRLGTGLDAERSFLEGIEMDIVPRLEAARNQTLGYFDVSDGQLYRTYGSGKWSVRFIVHHLADAGTVLFDRIRRVLSGPRQLLWAFDQDAWATQLDYSRLPLDLSRRIYDAVQGWNYLSGSSALCHKRTP